MLDTRPSMSDTESSKRATEPRKTEHDMTAKNLKALHHNAALKAWKTRKANAVKAAKATKASKKA
jgi:hypothetical protein